MTGFCYRRYSRAHSSVRRIDLTAGDPGCRVLGASRTTRPTPGSARAAEPVSHSPAPPVAQNYPGIDLKQIRRELGRRERVRRELRHQGEPVRQEPGLCSIGPDAQDPPQCAPSPLIVHLGNSAVLENTFFTGPARFIRKHRARGTGRAARHTAVIGIS